jgi:hypothetical protein
LERKLKRISFSGKQHHSIESITFLRYTYEEEFVYDLETVSGNFQAGIGELIVKNTDSVFINFTDHIKQLYPDRTFTEKELLEESIKMGELAAKNINKNVKSPQNIEYEKTFWPFCIFSKKRYFGNKYEHSIQKFKETYMGIALKRRDYAYIVKKVYSGTIHIILNEKDIEGAKKYFYKSVKDLLEGNVEISELVISKTIKTDYSNPNQIAHKVLADRIGERDPGNKPQSNDRVPYCYIEVSNLKCKICNKKINPDKSKCIDCMSIYCVAHLYNHRNSCVKICRFCKKHDSVEKCTKCDTCTGNYCDKCFIKHKTGKDKYGNEHQNKCKKELTPKLLQGDTIEHPEYILEKNLKIDYYYYLTNQIENPVLQIFGLVMDSPSSIIKDLVRDIKNRKSQNTNIQQFFKPVPKPIVEDIKSKNWNAYLNDGMSNENILDFEEEIDENENSIDLIEINI